MPVFVKSMSSSISQPPLPLHLGKAMWLGCSKEKFKTVLGLAIKNFPENPPALPSPFRRPAHVSDGAAIMAEAALD